VSKKSKLPRNYDPGIIVVGNAILILRGHLWSSCLGVVEKAEPDGRWLLAIKGKNGSVFHTVAAASELSVRVWTQESEAVLLI
jgi:hypothetical protein